MSRTSVCYCGHRHGSDSGVVRARFGPEVEVVTGKWLLAVRSGQTADGFDSQVGELPRIPWSDSRRCKTSTPIGRQLALLHTDITLVAFVRSFDLLGRELCLRRNKRSRLAEVAP